MTCATLVEKSVQKASKINLVTLTAFSGQRNVMVWRPSVRPAVCLSRRHTQRDSPATSTRRGQRSFPSDCYEDERTCYRTFDDSCNVKLQRVHRSKRLQYYHQQGRAGTAI